MEPKYIGKTDDECISIFRQEVEANNNMNSYGCNCIVYGCKNKVMTDQWDNKVLCCEHHLILTYWFYELDGAKYNPDIYDESGKKLPKPDGSDPTHNDYRKRYCDWILSLSKDEYRRILLWSIK
jgi:hypothetical protein